MSAFLPPLFYFTDRRSEIESMSSNEYYKWAWKAIGIGHLVLYLFPGLLFPVSLTSDSIRFNTWYVMWQQYGTYLTGTSLAVVISGLFAASYFTYETDADLDESRIMWDGQTYFVFSLVSYVLLKRNNENF